MELIQYDEFGLFHENAQEVGLPFDRSPAVRREFVPIDSTRRLSALVWGTSKPQLVFLHGGAQNAHTWDTVALALDRPLVAIDLPGHGHSDASGSTSLSPADNAADVAAAMHRLAPQARAVIGMSLGGLTAIALSTLAPDLVARLVLVDVTPGVNEEKSAQIRAFINGPASFASFDEILARTVQFNPTRSVSSLRRGILHNAVQQPDGSWVWRYRRFSDTARRLAEYGVLWDDISALRVPLMLVRGMLEQSVVDDADEAELVRRCPGARVEHVLDAGHSVQGDTPLELASLIDDFVDH
jgi:pimeloyl-ACP methyl ester carboxylesterase